MSKRGQAAMEFLMTYGWAIVVVLAAIGALAYFGVLSPNKLLPDRTVFSAPLPSVDNAVIDLTTNTVSVAFKNNKGTAIKIPRTPATGGFVSDQCTGTPSPEMINVSSEGVEVSSTTPIQNGDGFIITWACTEAVGTEAGDKFKAEVSFDYVNDETDQTIKQSGTIDGKFT